MSEPEIMTIEEVAAYLRVSERTVYDWAQKGEIPGGKIGTSWRFRRKDIDAWVGRKLASPSSKEVNAELDRVLSPRRVCIYEQVEKNVLLDHLIQLLSSESGIKDKREFHDAVFRREELMSTGIGLGVAVPHVRLPSVGEVLMAAALCRQPIRNYESLDGQPVHLVFMIVAGEDQHAAHIRLLSALSRQIKDEGFRKLLLASPDETAFYSTLIRGAEKG